MVSYDSAQWSHVVPHWDQRGPQKSKSLLQISEVQTEKYLTGQRRETLEAPSTTSSSASTISPNPAVFAEGRT